MEEHEEFKVEWRFDQPPVLETWSLQDDKVWVKGSHHNMYSKEGIMLYLPKFKRVRTKYKIGYVDQDHFGIVLNVDEYNLFNGVLGTKFPDYTRIEPVLMDKCPPNYKKKYQI